MKRNVKLLLLGIVATVIVIGAVYSLVAPISLPLTEIAPKTVELSFTEQGLVAAGNVVQIYPLVQGRLMEIKAAEGQIVSAGDVICTIDPEPLLSNIARIESSIEANRAQINNLAIEQKKLRDELGASRISLLGELAALEARENSSNVSAAELLSLQEIIIEQIEKDLDWAIRELERVEFLYSIGDISLMEYEEMLAAAQRMNTSLETARQELAIIKAGRDSEEYFSALKTSINARISAINESLSRDYTEAMTDYFLALIRADEALIEQLRRDVENCNVVATVSGVITELSARNTNYASGAVPLAEITALSDNRIEVFVATKDIDSIKLGDEVELILKRREGNIVFPGFVSHVDATAILRVSALGVQERRVKVSVTPESDGIADVSLGVGYSVDVKFLLYSEVNKYAVPKTAVFRNGDKDMLWVVRNGKAQAIEVIKGAELRAEYVIESGLSSGDHVVNDANEKALRNGKAVRNSK